MDVTVVTAAVPDRLDMLAECMESVRRQTHPVVAHLVAVDHGKIERSESRNRLLLGVRTEWVAFLDDDDLFFPEHFERLAAHVEDHDFVYSWCKCWHREYDRARLKDGNFIPVCAPVVRTRMVMKAGGFPTNQTVGEDHSLWKEVVFGQGARVFCLPEYTFDTRPHGNREIRPYWELADGQDQPSRRA